MKKLFLFGSLFVFGFVFVLLSGCVEDNVPGIPYSTAQLIVRSTDLNYSLFVQGYYDGNCLLMDLNKISVGSCGGAAGTDWDLITNFPAGCGAGEAVQIIGSTLTCIPVGGVVDANVVRSVDENLVIPVLVDGNCLRVNGSSLAWGECGSGSTGSGVDTNWQTSWSVFDANMRNYFIPYQGANKDINIWAQNLFLLNDANHVDNLRNMASGFDEMRNNTLLDASRSSLACSGGVLTYTLYALNQVGEWDFNNKVYGNGLSVPSADVNLTCGTDLLPKTNYIYYELVAGVPTLKAELTYSTVEHIDVGTFIVGACSGTNYTIYSYNRNRYETDTFVTRSLQRWEEMGALYVSGLAPSVSTTDVNIDVGSFFNNLVKFTSGNVSKATTAYFFVKGDGNYINSVALTDLNTYTDSSAIASNEYYNIVWGVVPTTTTSAGTVATTVKLVAVKSTKPTNKYLSVADAQADIYETTNFFPPTNELRKTFVPVARTVLKAGVVQTLASGLRYIDLRGKNLTSSGGSGGGSALTLGNLTPASTKVSITGGTGAVFGAGTTLDVNVSQIDANGLRGLPTPTFFDKNYFSSNAVAKTYYVSTTGTDSLLCGAIGLPCRTAQYIISNFFMQNLATEQTIVYMDNWTAAGVHSYYEEGGVGISNALLGGNVTITSNNYMNVKTCSGVGNNWIEFIDFKNSFDNSTPDVNQFRNCELYLIDGTINSIHKTIRDNNGTRIYLTTDWAVNPTCTGAYTPKSKAIITCTQIRGDTAKDGTPVQSIWLSTGGTVGQVSVTGLDLSYYSFNAINAGGVGSMFLMASSLHNIGNAGAEDELGAVRVSALYFSSYSNYYYDNYTDGTGCLMTGSTGGCNAAAVNMYQGAKGFFAQNVMNNSCVGICMLAQSGIAFLGAQNTSTTSKNADYGIVASEGSMVPSASNLKGTLGNAFGVPWTGTVDYLNASSEACEMYFVNGMMTGSSCV